MSRVEEPDEWLTTEDLAEWLKVPIRTVQDWRVRQVGPDAKKIGRSVRYRRSEVERWIDSGDAGKQVPPPSQRVVVPPLRRRAPRG